MDQSKTTPTNDTLTTAPPPVPAVPEPTPTLPDNPSTPPVEDMHFPVPQVGETEPISTPEVSQTPAEQVVVSETTEETNAQEPLPPSNGTPKKSKIKIVAAIAGVILLIGSVAAGVVLVQNNQETREKAQGVHPDGCARSTDTVQCLDQNQQKEDRNIGFNAVCYDGANPAESILIAENRCPLYKHADGCARLSDTVQCLSQDQQKEDRNIGFNAVCYTAVGNPAESILIAENRCPLYKHADGCARLTDTVQCLSFTQKQEARNIGFNAVCYTKEGNPAESILVSNNRCGAPVGAATPSCDLAVSQSGNTVTATLTISGRPANDTDEYAVINWGLPGADHAQNGFVAKGNATTTVYTSTRTYPSSAIPGTYTITGSIDKLPNPVPYHSECANNDAAGLARRQKSITLTSTPVSTTEARCTTVELLRGGSVIYSSAGGTTPTISSGDQLQLRAYCYSTDPADDFDLMKFEITAPGAAAQATDKAATRDPSKDQGAQRFFVATHNFTASATGSYTIKVWGHTPNKNWKGQQ